MKKHIFPFSILFFLFVFGCKNEPASQEQESPPLEEKSPDAISLFGKELFSPPYDTAQYYKWNEALAAYEEDKKNIDKLIWLGRRSAYMGKYKWALSTYSRGIEEDSNDARLWRHRGHRYITIRKFDAAIKDLEIATQIIEGTENEIEPDGIPNARNTPISTLHGNIWYHLGLAYYLKQDWENALRAYRQCRAVSSNADNLVSSGHWLYMILNRMGRSDEAVQVLEPISADMDIIENFAYHQLCLFYKGELSIEELQPNGSAGSSDAILYGVANWHFYNGEKGKAKKLMEEILEKDSWNSFGYIAAEADLFSEFEEN